MNFGNCNYPNLKIDASLMLFVGQDLPQPQDLKPTPDTLCQVYRVPIGVKYRYNGKENGNYYIIIGHIMVYYSSGDHKHNCA